jgi:predicted ATP-binding protein involved in virulence
MQVKELKLTNCRGLTNSSIPFKSGMNLIVGVNGAGKSTVLESLSILLSQVLGSMTKGIAPTPEGFELDDISHGQNTLDARLLFETTQGNALQLNCIKHRSNVESVIHTREEKTFRSGEDVATFRTKTETVKDGTELVSSSDGKPASVKLDPLPLLILFSVERSRPTYEKGKLKKIHPAYAGAFSSKRGFNINDVVEWWESKEVIASEAPEGSSARQVELIQKTLNELCPQFSNWRLERDAESAKEALDLWVDKTVDTTILDEKGNFVDSTKQQKLRVRQLSDGERSIIAMCFDIARRLILLNEKDDDPVKNGRGIVLIDEIDLHLHPEWQRKIVTDLPRVFPSLQFIATTHSPQTIGETTSGQVVILEEGGNVRIEPESLGRSSGWILRHIMDSSERNVEMKKGLEEIDQHIDNDEYTKARELIAELREKFGNDPDLISAEASVNRWEFDADEEDS